MTIPSTQRRAGPFAGTGAQTAFPFTFKVFAEGDVAVTVADSLGVETTLVLNTDYSVALNANQETSPGGTVTYPVSGSPLPTGSVLAIVGDLDYDQPLDLPSGGNFSPLALENQLDRVTMQVQQLREILNRALLAPVTSSASGQLPQPEASALIGWDATETALQNVPIADLATTIGYGVFRNDTFTGDGATQSFATTADPIVLSNLTVSVDGLALVPGVDFTLSGGSVVFTAAPTLGAEILVRYGEAITDPGMVGDATSINFTPAGNIVAANVQAAIEELDAEKEPAIVALATTKGGSGASYASAAALFAGIKQAATTGASGVVELATDAEAQAGTDAARAVTPDNLGATVLGMGQTWQNVVGSRAIGSAYTNSTGRPIMVSITAQGTSTATSSAVSFTVGGVTLGVIATNDSYTTAYQGLSGGMCFVVPAGATYSVANAAGVNTLQTWAELR